MNRLTVTVEECGCPAGRYRASAGRHGILEFSDDPFEAQRRALQAAIDQGEFDYTPPEYLSQPMRNLAGKSPFRQPPG